MTYDAITVENLSKTYLIGHQHHRDRQAKYTALRDVIVQEARNFARKAADVARGRQIIQGDKVEEFVAIDNVSFTVKQGEVLGIIGRNGAGKSTLLKVLSRITEPTKGRITLRGRVSSLLEVGTGFHPELTGRENIYLNGAILGMTRREITKKFDEIVDFAEVEKFLDTPVKHYSSGMFVRLAFAVAAHLEPEILVVDEVLAVGDTEFQKKCLGKMDDVSRRGGRTILFVSHNMETVLKLCTRGLFLESGRVRDVGSIDSIVSRYLNARSSSPRLIDLSSKDRPPYIDLDKSNARLARLTPSDSGSNWSIPFAQPLSFDISIDAKPSIPEVTIFFEIFSVRGFEIATWSNSSSRAALPVHAGINTFRIGFPDFNLLPGQYYIGISVVCGERLEDYLSEAVTFEIVTSTEAARIKANNLRGAMVPSGTVSILE
jgi:lipopolysaccharide transport system ATP-binding protein